MPSPSKTLFKLEDFLNFQKLFPKSTERKPESNSIWLCRRLQAVVVWGISNTDFFGIAQREGVEGGMWRKGLGRQKKGYLGLGNCVFLYVCIKAIILLLKIWETTLCTL